MTLRLIEQANAAMLPRQPAERVQAYCQELNTSLAEIDAGGRDTIDRLEGENRKMSEENKAKAQRLLAGRKGAGRPKRRHPKKSTRRIG